MTRQLEKKCICWIIVKKLFWFISKTSLPPEIKWWPPKPVCFYWTFWHFFCSACWVVSPKSLSHAAVPLSCLPMPLVLALANTWSILGWPRLAAILKFSWSPVIILSSVLRPIHSHLWPGRCGWLHLDIIKLSGNQWDVMLRGEVRQCVHQASLCTWPREEQIWVLVQARSLQPTWL